MQEGEERGEEKDRERDEDRDEDKDKDKDKEKDTAPGAGTISDSARPLQIRGLNHSFTQAIKQKLEREPAADLAALFRQYESHWRTIAARYPQATGKSATAAPPSTQDKPAALATFAAKAGRTAAPSTMDPDAGKPAPPFAFGAEINKPAGPFKFGTEADAPAQPFAFGTEARKPTAASTFGAEPAATPSKEPKSAGKPAPADKPAPFAFGASADKPSLSFGQSSIKDTVNAPAGSLPPFSFTAFGTSNASAASPNPPAPVTAVPSTTSPFSFGGLTSSSSAPAAAPFSFSFSTPMPSFSTQPAATAVAAGANDDEEGIPEGEEASFSGDRTNAELIKRGAGEEDEETLAEERIKLFTLEREGGGWKDLGIALAKINRSQSTDKRRLLARSEGTGKVLLNTWIGGTATKVDRIEGKRDFTLVCVGAEGKPAQYLIRCKEPSQAASFSAAISRS